MQEDDVPARRRRGWLEEERFDRLAVRLVRDELAYVSIFARFALRLELRRRRDGLEAEESTNVVA
jgi:hypothetical protein